MAKIAILSDIHGNAYALLKERNIAAELIPDDVWDEASAMWKWNIDP